MSKIDKRLKAGFFQLVLWYLLYFVIGYSVLYAKQDNYVYFNRSIQYWDFFPEVRDIQHTRPKTLTFKTSDVNWNNHFWDTTKRISKLRMGKESGLIDGTFILFTR